MCVLVFISTTRYEDNIYEDIDIHALSLTHTLSLSLSGHRYTRDIDEHNIYEHIYIYIHMLVLIAVGWALVTLCLVP